MSATQNQKAARNRNWQLYKLKSVLPYLRQFLPEKAVVVIENEVRRKIDEQWQADSFKY